MHNVYLEFVNLKQSVIFYQQNRFIWDSKELQLRTCNHGEPHASLVKQKMKLFYREKGKLGGAVINKKSIGGNWEFEV